MVNGIALEYKVVESKNAKHGGNSNLPVSKLQLLIPDCSWLRNRFHLLSGGFCDLEVFHNSQLLPNESRFPESWK